MSSPDNLALYERERLEPPTNNILTARMLETADRLKDTIRELEDEQYGILSLHLSHLPNDLKAQVFEHYDSELANRRQELADVRQNLSARGYIT